MEGFGSYLLDVLGEFAGGRGGAANDLPRFGLSAICWMFIWGFSLSAYKRYSHSRERWLLVGCSIGLFHALFMFTVKSLKLYGVVSAHSLELFFPPLDHAFTFILRVVIAAAFIHYLLHSRTLAVTYLKGALVASAVFYLIVAPWWWFTVAASPPGIKFSHVWADWFAHGLGLVLTIAAMAIFSRTRGWVFVTVSIAFSMFLLDDILMLANLATSEIYKTVLTPIRHNLQLWAIPIFGYIYWREQAEIHHRLVQNQQRSERLEVIGRLASGVAHDFNNHLQAILGFSELGMSQSDSRKQNETFNHIATSTDRAATLVNQLLSFSRQDKMDTCDNVYVERLIPELIPMLQRIMGSEIKIHTEENHAIRAIWTEQSMLEQIIINLVVNSRDAIPHGGHIYLKTRDIKSASPIRGNEFSADGWVQVEVSDTGEGMDPDTVEHIFEPFYTTKQVGKGTGLGLATVQNIVQNLGGSIEVKSEVGRGTSICVNFPASGRPDENIEKDACSASYSTGSETILVAEDDQLIRGLTAGMLESAGYKVLTAMDGEEAMQLAIKSETAIDLLLFDVAMPKLNGYVAYENIIQDIGRLPILFFTANTERALRLQPAYQHLTKPIKRLDLLVQVRRALDVAKPILV